LVADPHVELLYVEGCPSWEVVAVRLSVALQATGNSDNHVHLRRIETVEEAEQSGFTGSPMIRVNGVDPLGHHEAGLVLLPGLLRWRRAGRRSGHRPTRRRDPGRHKM